MNKCEAARMRGYLEIVSSFRQAGIPFLPIPIVGGDADEKELKALLEKRLGMQIGGCDAYVNLAGGIRITEPAIDLGIVMAIMSSFKNSPVPEGVVAFGEVGLSGEVRAVSMAEQRVREAQKLGFTTCILPQVCLEKMPKISGIRLVGVRSVADAAREL